MKNTRKISLSIIVMLFALNSYAAIVVDNTKDSNYMEFGELVNGASKVVGKSYYQFVGDQLYIYVEAIDPGTISYADPEEITVKLELTTDKGTKVTYNMDDFIKNGSFESDQNSFEASIQVEGLIYNSMQIHTDFLGVTEDEKISTGSKVINPCYDCKNPDAIPIDGGLGLLLTAGVGFGIKTFRSRKK